MCRLGLIPRLACALGVATAIAPAAIAAPPAGALAEQKMLTLGGAKQVIAAAESAAKQLNAPSCAIAVADDGGHLLVLERLDGTFAAAAPLAERKARSAANFRKPTADFENAIKNGRLSLVANPELLPLQGGVPIVIDGQVVGAVGVAGAASAQQDEDIAKAAAAAFAP